MALNIWRYCKALISQLSLICHCSFSVLLTCRIQRLPYRPLPLHPSPQTATKYYQEVLSGGKMTVQIINRNNNENSIYVYIYNGPGTCSMYLISSILFNLHKIPIKQFLNNQTIEISGWIILCCDKVYSIIITISLMWRWKCNFCVIAQLTGIRTGS